MLLAFGVLAGSAAFAQQAAGDDGKVKARTQQVIAGIPSLQAIAQEIAVFESKTEGKSAEYKNANADLKALKMKYANELRAQISLNEKNKATAEILAEELKKTEEAINKL